MVGLAYALSGSRAGSEDSPRRPSSSRIATGIASRGYDHPDVWVRRVVTNMSMSMFRRRYAEAKALARIAIGDRDHVAGAFGRRCGVLGAVRSLPRRQAQVITLHYLEDRPVAEIAEILGTAEGTVKKHLYDGRQAVARRLRLEEDDA